MDSGEKQKMKLMAAFLFIVVVIGGLFFLIQRKPIKTESFEKAIENNCVLDYGKSKCFNEHLVVPFYNSGEKTIGYVRIIVPVLNGEDIFNIYEPLKPQEAKSATLSKCNKVKNETLTLAWCCEKCYETKMNQPKEEIRIWKTH